MLDLWYRCEMFLMFFWYGVAAIFIMVFLFRRRK
jgi:hypothetical protein